VVALGGSVEVPTSSIIQVIKLDASLDKIKLATGLGTDATDTLLTETTAALADMATRAVAAIVTKAVDGVMSDSTAPTIPEVDLNMDTYRLTVHQTSKR
jgi:hypothetical protein